jgi:WD40 repeat protein
MKRIVLITIFLSMIILPDVGWSEQVSEIHPSKVLNVYSYSVAFSPDGAVLATGGEHGEIYIWRVRDGKLISTLQQKDEKLREVTLAISPEGNILASYTVPFHRTVNKNGKISTQYGKKQPVKLWDMKTGKLIRILDVKTKIWDYSYNCPFIFKPSGNELFIISRCYGEKKNITLWSIENGRLLRTIEGVKSAGLSPDGNVLIVTDESYKHKLIGANDGKTVLKLDNISLDRDSMGSYSFSPDGKLLATTGGEYGSLVYRVSDWGLMFTPKCFYEAEYDRCSFVNQVFIKNGAILVTGVGGRLKKSGEDLYTIRFWDMHDGSLMRTFIYHGTMMCAFGPFAMSPDGKIFAFSCSGEAKTLIWHPDFMDQ